MTTNEIQNKVDVNSIVFATKTKTKASLALVGYSGSQGVLTFNEKMVKLLGIKDWVCVKAGYDKKSKVIVLQNCEPNECGAIQVRLFPKKQKDGKPYQTDGRIISIAHMLNLFELSRESCKYKAECNGRMIFLEKAIEKTTVE